MTHLLQRPTGKVLIRVNAIETCKAIKEELVKKKIYKESEIHQLFSSLENKKSNFYKNLAHNREFFDQYKLVFTTAMIDEGVSIEQMGFTDVIFIETNYNPRPEPIKQFFARFRNEDPNRKNYLYLRKKKAQMPTRFDPQSVFEANLEQLILESEEYENSEVLTTYNNLFSNNRYYHNDATINNYYLAFAATEVLYKYFNIEQFLDYLRCNYNLAFHLNEEYEVKRQKSTIKEHIDEVKQRVATNWCKERVQVNQALLYHSQNPQIMHAINKQQICMDKDIELSVREDIKHYETLFLREKELRDIGIDNPQEYLIKSDSEGLTLHSNDHYNKRVAVLKVQKAISEPQTKADRRTAERFIHFGQWCVSKGTFSYKQMCNELKRIGVVNYKAFNEKMLFEILGKNFNLDVKRNKKINLITCKERGSTET